MFLLTILTCIMGSMAFQGLLLLEYGVVLKRTEMCVFGGGAFTCALPGFALPERDPLA